MHIEWCKDSILPVYPPWYWDYEIGYDPAFDRQIYLSVKYSVPQDVELIINLR